MFQEKQKMSNGVNKLIIPIIVVVVVAAGIGAYFVFQKPALPEPQIGRCGDGVCDDLEKANPSLCPKDCQEQMVNESTTKAIFISGFKIQNVKNIQELSEATFKLANELELDYVLVPVSYSKELDWSSGLDYYYIFELADKYNVSVLPAFYKLGGSEDKNYEKYADFVVSFLDEFYEKREIDYIEFQNEPVSDYSGQTSRHFKGTPTDLAKSNTAAYDKVKEKYPLIKVGTAGFLAASDVGDSGSSDEHKIMNDYYKEYFSAKPKFDTFNLHHYPKTSSYLQKTQNLAGLKYNFASEYEVFQTYRYLLNDYGYNNKPILVTEGAVHMPFREADERPDWNWLDDEEVAILLMERFVLTLGNSKDKNIIGSMISEVEGSDKTALFDYNEKTGDYTKTNKFYFYKKLLEFIRKYPIHSKHIAGKVDSEHYWVEEFKDEDGKKMWMAFCPFLFWTEAESSDKPAAVVVKKSITCPQEVTFEVGNIKSAKISNSIDGQTESKDAKNGKISFTLNKAPLFIAEQ